MMRTCRCVFGMSLMMAAHLATAAVAGSSADRQALLNALRDADETHALQLIDDKASLNERDESGATALMWSVQRGNADLVARLLKAGADPDIRDAEGLGPLQLAIGLRATEIALRLIAEGADAQVTRDSGETALMTAARAGQLEVMKQLIARGADVNAHERQFHQTALMWSAGYPQQVRLLIEHGADIHARTKTWEVTDTIYAADALDLSASEASQVYVNRKGGQSAIFFAVQRDDVESVKTLLDVGVDINDTAADGSTALLLAVYKWNSGGKRYGQGCADNQSLVAFAPSVKIANLLLDRGARVTSADSAGYTPLHGAVLAGVSQVRMDKCRTSVNKTEYAKYPDEFVADPQEILTLVQRMLTLKADPNAVTRHPTPGAAGQVRINPAPVGSAPLHIAAETGNADLIRLLLEHGGNPNLLRSDGHSPLSVATRADDLLSVKLLLAHGGDARRIYNPTDTVIDEVSVGGIESTSVRGEQSLLHIAAAAGSSTVVSLLHENGAPLDLRNNKGETALALAESQDRWRYVRRKAIAEGLRIAGVPDGPDPASIVPDTKTSVAIKRLTRAQVAGVSRQQ